MENFGVFMTFVFCIVLAIFLIFAAVSFFMAPVVVETNPVILKIPSAWSPKIEAGYYRLGEKIERKIIYGKKIVEESE